MPKIIVTVSPYQGEYDMQEDRVWNGFEWEWITEISGYMPLTINEGFAGGNPSLYIAMAVIAMQRAGKVQPADIMRVANDLKAVPFDGEGISITGDEVAEDEVPLDSTPTPAEPSRPGSLSSVG